jgi:hypothetical protein
MLLAERPKPEVKPWALPVLLSLSFLAHLPVLLFSHGASFDLESYAKVAHQLLSGGHLYGNPELAGRYPYLPAWALLLLLMKGISFVAGLSFELCVKLPGVMADLGLTAIIYRIIEQLDGPTGGRPLMERRAFWAALAYGLSPMAILISAGHGQFDALPLLCILMAYHASECSGHPNSDRHAALWMGGAIALKTWPLALMPVFLKGLPSFKEQTRFVFQALLIPAALSLPFLIQDAPAMLSTVLGHKGAAALGLTEFLHAAAFLLGVPPAWLGVARWVMFAGTLGLWGSLVWIYLRGTWEPRLEVALALGVLTLYVAAPGLAPQHLLWLLPMALLMPGSLGLRYGFYGLVALLGFYCLLMPEAFLSSRHLAEPILPPAILAVWGLFNLGFWGMLVREWLILLKFAASRRSPRAHGMWI